jgi:branched-chain amino acid transport system ATP-binding protein
MSRPRLLLLDEPSLGLAPLIVESIFNHIRTIREEEGMTVLLVEQDAAIALDIADYGYVLETGRIAIEGPAARLREDEGVRRTYLGY